MELETGNGCKSKSIELGIRPTYTNSEGISSRTLPSKSDFSFPMEKVFDNFFDNFFDHVFNSKSQFKKDFNLKGCEYPKMDIFSENNKMLLKAAVPGVDPNDVKIEITQDGLLKISGKSSQENRSESSNYFSKELRMSQFSRTVQLPKYLVNEEPVAEIKNGMLTLSWDIPKPEEKEKIRTIEIKKN
jgi:HSP20 family protein